MKILVPKGEANILALAVPPSTTKVNIGYIPKEVDEKKVADDTVWGSCTIYPPFKKSTTYNADWSTDGLGGCKLEE